MNRGVSIVLALVAGAMTQPAIGEPGRAEKPGALEIVRGVGCYTYSDQETPAMAKKQAMAGAQEQAVQSYRVFVASATTVKNFQLESDVIRAASAGMLHDVQIEKTEKKEQEICIGIVAKIDPVEMDSVIQQKVKAKDTAQAIQTALLGNGSTFGLKVWTNKSDNAFVEGDPLLVSVQSDRDGYLKLDYFQADNTVVHLVPNVFGGEAFIKAGQVYTFGASGGQETFTIQAPFGAETIKALVSTKPFDQTLQADKNVDDSRAYFATLQRGTRGVRVESGNPTSWAEAAIGLNTSSRSVEDYTRNTRGLRKQMEPPAPIKPTAITGGTGHQPDTALPRP